jgi:hypothetical protein
MARMRLQVYTFDDDGGTVLHGTIRLEDGQLVADAPDDPVVQSVLTYPVHDLEQGERFKAQDDPLRAMACWPRMYSGSRMWVVPEDPFRLAAWE